MTEKRVRCGICEASCGSVAAVEDDEIVKLRPDGPIRSPRGSRARRASSSLKDPDRLRDPVKRMPDGGNNLANPLPDFERTDFALVLGANPVALARLHGDDRQDP